MAEQKTEKKPAKEKIIIVSGKCKEAIAKATIKNGTGIIKFNKKPLSHLPFLRKLALEEPLKIAELQIPLNFDISINAKSGGIEGQIHASRLAIARAIVAFTKNDKIKRAFLDYDRALLVADVRRKEAYKPGDSKARAKRQKSYR